MCRKYQSSYGTVWVKCTEEVILVELKTCQHSYCSTINDLIKNQTSILIFLQLWDGNDLKLRIVDTKWTSIKVVGQKIIFLNASFHIPCQNILIYWYKNYSQKPFLNSLFLRLAPQWSITTAGSHVVAFCLPAKKLANNFFAHNRSLLLLM